MQEGDNNDLLESDMSIDLSYLAFIDNSSRGPSRKKRASPTGNHDEPYVDVKVLIVQNVQVIEMRYSLEPIDAGYSSSHSTRRSNAHIIEHVNGRFVEHSLIEIRFGPLCDIRI